MSFKITSQNCMDIGFDYDLALEFHYGTSARDGCRQLVPAVALQVQI